MPDPPEEDLDAYKMIPFRWAQPCRLRRSQRRQSRLVIKKSRRAIRLKRKGRSTRDSSDVPGDEAEEVVTKTEDNKEWMPSRLLELWRREGRRPKNQLDVDALWRYEEAKLLGFLGGPGEEDDFANFEDSPRCDSWEDARAVAYIFGAPRAFTLGALRRRRALRNALSLRGASLPDACDFCDAFIFQGEPVMSEVVDAIVASTCVTGSLQNQAPLNLDSYGDAC